MIFLLDADGIIFSSCYDKDAEDKNQSNIEEAVYRFDSKIEELIEVINENFPDNNVDSTIVFIEGLSKISFRKIIYPNYKQNRNSKKPLLFNELKERIINSDKWDVHVSNGVESDDSVASSWNFLKDLYGADNVIVGGVDKDLKQMPCLFIDYYHSRFGELSLISEDEARINFFEQMVKGDKADNITGIKGMGDVAWRKIVDSNKVEQLESIVFNTYKEKYGDFDGARLYFENYNLLNLSYSAPLPNNLF